MKIKPFSFPPGIEFTTRQVTTKFVVHHSDSGDVSAKTIDGWHINRPEPFKCIGYHLVVRQDGSIEAGRPLNAIGAHAKGANLVSVGICLTGDFNHSQPTQAQINSTVELIHYLWEIYPEAEVVKHSDCTATDCPGTQFPWDSFINLLEVDSMSKFKDIDQCWYPELALKAVEEGIIGGYSDGTLRPKEPVTREQMWLVDLRQQKIISQIPYIPGMVEKFMPSVVRIWANSNGKQTVGSGSFVTPKLILTNYHVVGDNDVVSVDTHDKHPQNNKTKCRVIKRDKYIDLALVEYPETRTPLKLADGATHGEFCLVLGNPGGEFESVTAGIVAHNDRGDFIETDARINPGNSGGACVNSRGELIGVPVHKIALPAFDNQNYCIRISKVKEFLKGVI